jgi:hypothetical protein
MTTDEEAEAFFDQDLSDLDFSQFKPVRFEERQSTRSLPSNSVVRTGLDTQERCMKPRKPYSGENSDAGTKFLPGKSSLL